MQPFRTISLLVILVINRIKFLLCLGVLKRSATSLSSEILREKGITFAEESSKFTFVLRTKKSKFDGNLG